MSVCSASCWWQEKEQAVKSAIAMKVQHILHLLVAGVTLPPVSASGTTRSAPCCSSERSSWMPRTHSLLPWRLAHGRLAPLHTYPACDQYELEEVEEDAEAAEEARLAAEAEGAAEVTAHSSICEIDTSSATGCCC